MCDHCVVDSVKQRLLSRRAIFGGAAAAAVSVAGGLASPAEAQTRVSLRGKVVDLTHTLHPEFPTYFGAQQFFVEQKFSYAKDKFNLNEWRLNEHTGTHMDAPLHFSADGQSVGDLAVDKLVIPLAVIDIRAKAEKSADAQVTPDDIKAWSKKYGPLPKGCCVAMNSGWDAHVKSAKFRNADDAKKMHFPGFHIEATKMLLESGRVIGMAVDTLSLDYGLSADFATHYAWLPTGRWGLECVANLSAVPVKGATLVVGAPKVKGGTGGLTRVLAIA
jgi:kynurenine formamidase